MKRIARTALLSCAVIFPASVMPIGSAAYAQTANRNYSIAAQDLGDALRQFATQSGRDVVFDPALTAGKSSKAVQGSIDTQAALRQLIEGSGLTFTSTSNGFAIRGNVVAGDEAGEGSPEIVVVGSNISGLRNPTSQLISYDRKYIDQTGYSTVQELVRSLPQNFWGGVEGASEDGQFGAGSNARGNREGATGVNLRGLGVGGTLVLLNGQRLAPAAYGSVVNVGLIPLSAVQRVEILPEGSSALYGADAVGGVVNFILRKGYRGGQSTARYGWADGGLDELTLSQDVGLTWQGGDALIAGQYRSRDNLPSSSRTFTEEAIRPNDLLADIKQFSILTTARQDLGPDIRLDITGLLTRNTSSRDISISSQSYNTDFTDKSLSLAAKATYDISPEWNISFKSSVSRNAIVWKQTFLRGAPLNTPFLEGRNSSRIWGADVLASGKLLTVWGKTIGAALGASYREERLNVISGPVTTRIGVDDRVKAAYGELFWPIIGPDDNLSFVREFDVSIAGRVDSYSRFGDTFNPKIGVRYSPSTGVSFRSSYGTSFRPPNLRELYGATNQNTAIRLNLRSPGGGTVPVYGLGGSDPLVPEKSKNFTVGLDWSPTIFPGLAVSASYYLLKYRDRIITPPFDSFALLKPEIYGSLISPLPDDAAAAAFAAEQLANGVNVIGSPTGIRYVYNIRQQNAASVKQGGLDFELRYGFKVFAGEATARLGAAWIKEIDTQLTQQSRTTDVVGTYANPSEWRLRGDLGWAGRGTRLSLALNFTDSYDDTTVTPSRRTGSYTTLDLSAQFDLPMRTTFGVVVANILNQQPPYIANAGRFLSGIHYDPANANVLGRLISLELRKSW